MVDGNKIIIIFYVIYCVCANYKWVTNGDLFQLVLGAE
jgi:hypothetical protein